MMQSLLAQALVAAALAILLLVLAVLLGVGAGYREEIKRRRLDLYAKVVFVLVTVAIVSYSYLAGALSFISLLILGAWVSLLILCTDWSRLGRKKKPLVAHSSD